ncbi:polysaccharide deacetylase family protein, partial [Streptomyces goshikiensis]
MVLAALLVAGLGTACGSSESGAPDKTEKTKTGKGAESGAAGALAQAEKAKAAQQARVALAKRWGLAKTPLMAPAAPKEKPEISTREGFEVEDGDELPHVFTTVPTEEKVVFLTIDDGAEKDPEFLKMMRELKIPYTAFLSDYLVRD